MAGSVGIHAETHVPAPAVPAPAAPAPAKTEAAPAALGPLMPERVLGFVDSYRRPLLATLVGLYLLGFNGQWRLEPDSALYLTIGRNLAEGRGYTYHGVSHHLAYPGLPWLFAGVFRIFGTDGLLPAHVIILLCGLATLALTYRLFHLHAGRPTAVLMTLLLGVSRTFYRYNFELLSDVPFLTGVMAFLVGYEAVFFRRFDRDVCENLPGQRGKPRWFDWALLVGGLLVAMMMRPTMWALLLAVVTSVVLSMFRRPVRKARIAVGVAILAAAVVAGVLFFSLDPRRGDRSHSSDLAGDYEFAFLEALGKSSHGFAHKVRANLWQILHPSASEAVFGIEPGHLDVGPHEISVSALPSLLCIAAALLVFRRRLLWGVWVAVTLLMMAVTVVHVRYFLQVMPLMLYGGWLAILWVNRRAGARGTVRAARVAGLGSAFVVFVLVTFNLLRVASLVREQRRVPFLAGYRDGKYAAVPQLAELVKLQTPDDGWVLAPQKYGRVLTYFSGRYVTEPGPVTQLNPAAQPVFVLEPMDALGQAWLAYYGIGTGAPVGPTIPGKRGKDWQLHQAVRVPSSGVLPIAPTPGASP